MIVVGGLTRLTDSGLSITEWRPVTGALPPMSAEAWDAEFEKYKAIPEYQLQNEGMTPVRVQDDLLVGMGASATWPDDRPCLGFGVPVFLGHQAHSARVDHTPTDPGRVGRYPRRDWLVDGVVRPDGRDAGRGVLPPCRPLGPGLCDPGSSGLVHHGPWGAAKPT